MLTISSIIGGKLNKIIQRGDSMHLLMIFSLLSMTALFLFTASRLSGPEVQPIKVRHNNHK